MTHMKRLLAWFTLAALILSGLAGTALARPRAQSLDAAGCVPAILVHGLNGDPRGWAELEAELEKESGCTDDKIFPIDYNNGHDFTHPDVTGVLKRHIDRLAKQSPNGKVDIIAHSMGGLVSRWLLAHDPDAARKVRSLIMIATPNQGSWVAYGIRMSQLVLSPESDGIGTDEESDSYRYYEAGRRAYAEFEQAWNDAAFWRKPDFHEWIGEHYQDLFLSLVEEPMREPIGRKVTRRIERVSWTQARDTIDLTDPYTRGFEALAAFYAGAYAQRKESRSNRGLLDRLEDLIRAAPAPVEPSELALKVAPWSGIDPNYVAIDRLLPTYAEIVVGRLQDGSALLLRIPTNPALLKLNEDPLNKPKFWHAYVGIQTISGLLERYFVPPLIFPLIDHTAGSVDPGYVPQGPSDGVVAASSVFWGRLSGLDSMFSVRGPNHLSIPQAKQTMSIVKALRSNHLALHGGSTELGGRDVSGTVRISPESARPSIERFRLSGPGSHEWDITTDTPGTLSLGVRSELVADEALLYVEDANGQWVETRVVTIANEEYADIFLPELPPKGRVILTTRAPADVYYQYYGLEEPPFPLPDVKPEISGATATALVVDVSLTMKDRFGATDKIRAVREITARVIEMIATARRDGADRHLITLIPFSSNAHVAVQLGTEYNAAIEYARGLTAWGGTNIGEALITAYAELLRAAAPHRSIVLLTDGRPETGMRQKQILQVVAPVLRRSNIPVMAVGVGDPDNLDEEFLKELAAITRGRYFHAGDQFALDNAFYHSYHASLGSVLLAVDGEVSQGETVEAGTFTAAAVRTIDVILNWPGSDMELILVDPKGREVDPSYPGARWESLGRPRRVVIDNPMRGTWTIKVRGLDVPEPSEPFHVTVSAIALPAVSVSREALAIALVVLGGGALLAYMLRQDRRAEADEAG